MTYEYARKYLQNVVDVYRNPTRIHPLVITPVDIAALEVAIIALKEREADDE